MTLRSLPFWVILLGTALVAPGQASARQGGGLTSIPGIKVGHHTLSERPTGCTVVLIEDGAVGGGDVRGAAPGTRETDLLDPVNSIQIVHAVVLSGGSAFGLAAADGVMRYLDERNIGFDVGVARVPIVPGAILFDLGVGGRPDVRPRPNVVTGPPRPPTSVRSPKAMSARAREPRSASCSARVER